MMSELADQVMENERLRRRKKLPNVIIDTIAKASGNMHQIAARFQVSYSYVCAIRRRKRRTK